MWVRSIVYTPARVLLNTGVRVGGASGAKGGPHSNEKKFIKKSLACPQQNQKDCGFSYATLMLENSDRPVV